MTRALQRSSLAVGEIYLKKLAAEHGRERSHYVSLYFGEYLTQSGNLRQGAMQFRRFLDEKGVVRGASVGSGQGVADLRDKVLPSFFAEHP